MNGSVRKPKAGSSIETHKYAYENIQEDLIALERVQQLLLS